MILFLDSNVTIGYVFKADKWNTPAKNIFKCPNQKYYSENVLRETKNKIKEISEKVYVNLLFLSSEIKKDKNIADYLRLDDVLRFLHRQRLGKKPTELLEIYINRLFLKRYSYEIGKEQLSEDLKQEANDFMSEYVNNFQFIRLELKKHDRKLPYSDLKGKLLKSHEDFHRADVFIILDAHDLCHVCNPLTLITADSQKERNELIIKFTNIDEVNDLRDFFIHKCP